MEQMSSNLEKNICTELIYRNGKAICAAEAYECEFKRDGKYCIKPLFLRELEKLKAEDFRQ